MVTKKHETSTEYNSVFALTPADPEAFENAKKLVFQKYPRIFLMLDAAWGSRELHQKLLSLLQVDNVKREGFPFDVCEALMIIQEQHADDFGYGACLDTSMNRLPDHW